uniref:Putative LOC100901383 [Metaseiulus occidentalis] n=1 Tax=Lepeophtheirus salmonis TaxID=72036 RepID=A0A0K2TQ41_LEPSM
MMCVTVIFATLCLVASSQGDHSPVSSYSRSGGAPPLDNYGSGSARSEVLASYGLGRAGGDDNDLTGSGSELNEVGDPIAMLEKAIPGVPGQDYPIYAEAPETGFSCDGQIDGGYYADSGAECQAFHICASNGAGGLDKYSFLCPNGTIFNQQYLICDWWFNFDCSQADSLAVSINADLLAARQEATLAAAESRINEPDFAGSENVGVLAGYGVGDARAAGSESIGVLAGYGVGEARAAGSNYGVSAPRSESVIIEAVAPLSQYGNNGR